MSRLKKGNPYHISSHVKENNYSIPGSGDRFSMFLPVGPQVANDTTALSFSWLNLSGLL